MSVTSTMKKVIKQYFVGGLLVVVPLIVTYLVLELLFSSVDGILGPLINKIFGFYWPGLGVLATLLLVILAGVLTRNYVGSRLLRVWDTILSKIPLIRPVYSGAKGLLQATTAESTTSFKEVVIIEYPQKGNWTVGFIANRIEMKMLDQSDKYAAVYLPSTPTPFTGWTVILSAKDVVPIDWTVEQAIKYVVSGGFVSPSTVGRREKLGKSGPEGVVSEAR